MNVIILLFITSFTIIGLALVRHFYSELNAKKRTLEGIQGVHHFVELIKFTQQHRGMHSGLLNGNLDFKGKLPQLEKDIQTQYEQILSFEKKHRYPPQLSIQYVHKQWQKLLQKDDIQSSQSFQLHTGLINRQLEALWDLADEFALTTSRQQAVRLTSQQLVKTLPELAEALGQIRALSVQVASKQDLSSDKKLQLIFTLENITEHHAKLSQLLPANSNQVLQQFIQDIKHSVEQGTLSQRNPDSLFQDASQIINQLFDVVNNRLIELKQTIR
ncbi:hypothetical protein [Marinomonas posidonica]|uniref:Nitrate/nitrite sensing protein domain-containing protein n=1 Tax=Marinomonas posidonica (strain CECT 7376 / NCIMB 14433 / IVIA-Po-181) TaxID=491952 RepID=F6CVC6_MARPP|nr:hypothetical protein [Marinomonas posidonica]AEF54236.1 hypothetical protein Mar181_1189 [Marinomonas posidonica IVIA-Po-181]